MIIDQLLKIEPVLTHFSNNIFCLVFSFHLLALNFFSLFWVYIVQFYDKNMMDSF